MLNSVKFKKSKALVMSVALSISLILPSILVNAAATTTFPYDSKYSYGYSLLADNQSSADQLLKTEWESWKSAHITSNGARGFKRVQRDAGSNYDTVSEGLGYGMLLAVYFNEQQLFNDLYGYVKSYFNSNGLMSWHIDANGNIIGNDGIGAATDADEDIAVALVFAHKKWGTGSSVNYESEAKSYISKIYNHMVEKGTYIIKNGDTWGGTNCVNPSYFSPAWYRIYADFTGNSEWIKVADKCYEIIDKAKNQSTGLVPDWCTAYGGQASGQGYNFLYDAIRYQWRAAIDYSWYGTVKAKTNCDQISNFFKKIGITNIKDGYTISGNQVNSNHTATFVACGVAAAMTGDDSAYAKSAYNECVKVKDQGSYVYFGNSLRMMALLYTTGNFPNLYTYTGNTNPILKKGDVNKDGSVDALDFAAIKKALLSQSYTEIDTKAADMNDDGNIDAVDYAKLKILLLSN